MIERIRRHLSGPNSWPILLIVIALAYWLSPADWWPVLTFALLCVIYLALGVAWYFEYTRIQRKRPAPAFIIAFACFGLALFAGSLLAAPNPLIDFSDWRKASRILWFIGLPFFAVAVYLECWRVYRALQSQME